MSPGTLGRDAVNEQRATVTRRTANCWTGRPEAGPHVVERHMRFFPGGNLGTRGASHHALGIFRRGALAPVAGVALASVMTVGLVARRAKPDRSRVGPARAGSSRTPIATLGCTAEQRGCRPSQYRAEASSWCHRGFSWSDRSAMAEATVDRARPVSWMIMTRCRTTKWLGSRDEAGHVGNRRARTLHSRSAWYSLSPSR